MFAVTDMEVVKIIVSFLPWFSIITLLVTVIAGDLKDISSLLLFLANYSLDGIIS